MDMVGLVQVAEEVVVTLAKVFSALKQVLLALVGQMSPSVWVEGLVDVDIGGIGVSRGPVSVTE